MKQRHFTIAIALILCFASLLLMTQTVWAQEETSSNIQLQERVAEVTSLERPRFEEFDQFIYRSNALSDRMHDFFNEGELYQENRLYLKNYRTGETTLLVNKNVTESGARGTRIYYIADSNQVEYYDLDTNEITHIYSSTGKALQNLYVTDVGIYFSEGYKILKAEYESGKVSTVGTYDGMRWFNILTNQQILMEVGTDDSSDYLILNTVSGEAVHYEDFNTADYAAYMLVNSLRVVPLSDTVDEEAYSPYAYDVVNPKTSVSFPLSDYPSGSYYNNYSNKSTPCTCHKRSGSADKCEYWNCDCKMYRESMQCMAFARYAFDVYANMTESQTITAAHHTVAGSSSDGLAQQTLDVKEYTKGTYLRVGPSKTSETHSFIIASNTASTITVYECNVGDTGQGCIVGMRTFTHEGFASKFYIFDIYKHSWSSYATKYSDRYHKRACSLGSCAGYILELHIGASCTKCRNSELLE